MYTREFFLYPGYKYPRGIVGAIGVTIVQIRKKAPNFTQLIFISYKIMLEG